MAVSVKVTSIANPMQLHEGASCKYNRPMILIQIFR